MQSQEVLTYEYKYSSRVFTRAGGECGRLKLVYRLRFDRENVATWAGYANLDGAGSGP